MKNQTKKNTIDVQLNLRLRFGHGLKRCSCLVVICFHSEYKSAANAHNNNKQTADNEKDSIPLASK
ncbi:MAG: hypothetical protein MK096_11640 [Oleiphilaceae bacterium]|nr:hypothetical protein [Oleiphilaceae bacterium]